jgi:beta-lactamase regulating signal transducer with metallopeptidase domain
MVATLARASVEGAIVVAIIWVLARLLQLSPAARTILWWCAAAKFVVALAWTTPIDLRVLPPESHDRPTVVQRSAAAAATQGTLPQTSRGRKAAVANPGLKASVANGLREWSSFAAIAWTLGLTAAALVGLRRWRDTAKMLRDSVAAAPPIQAEAADLSARLGLRVVPQVRVSASPQTPLVAGLVRPVVLLPANRLDALTDDQRRMVICHELAHVKRADLWLGCIPALAERIFFFHPLAHVASREYALARETACDAAVMRTLAAAPQEYGKLLLALGVSPRPDLSAAGAAWSFQNLKRRITMLQDTSVRSTRSRLLTAGIVGLAVAALIPLRLVARPAVTDLPAETRSFDVERAPVEAQAVEDAQVEKAEPRRDDKSGLRFVLMAEDGSRTTSGAFEAEDVKRAERQRRDGEPLLWFTYDGKEYVVRDVALLRQARSLWSDVNAEGFDHEAVRKLTDAVQSIDVGAIAEQGALIAQSIADSAMLADHARLAAEQGRHAAEMGLMIADQTMRALAESGLAGLDDLKLDQHLRSLDKHDLDHHLDKLSREIAEDVEDNVHELTHHLHENLSALHEPLKQLSGDDWKEFGDRMEHFGRSVGEAASKATEQMRELIERAIASGQARPVR